MAEDRTMKDAFIDALGDTLESARKAANGSETLRYAQAANELAEAYAWINRNDQPHGGNGRAL